MGRNGVLMGMGRIWGCWGARGYRERFGVSGHSWAWGEMGDTRVLMGVRRD